MNDSLYSTREAAVYLELEYDSFTALRRHYKVFPFKVDKKSGYYYYTLEDLNVMKKSLEKAKLHVL